MKRAFVYLSALVAMGGAIYLAGAIRAQAPPPAAAPAAQGGIRPTIAVFNVTEVLFEFKLAKYHGNMLQKKQMEMSKDMLAWRAEYLKKNDDLKSAKDQAVRDELTRALVDLTRKIEDKDREIRKIVSDEGSNAISQVHDALKTAVDRTAEANGYHVVFAYPEATSAEQAKTVMYKDMRLRPQAAQPFYVAKQVDITPVLIDTLNKWYAPPGPIPELPGPPPAQPGGPAQPVSGTTPVAGPGPGQPPMPK